MLINTKLLATLCAVLWLSACAATNPQAANAGFPENIVYHINDSANAGVAMNNVKNHLSANPQAHIVVVTHGKGIDFMLNGAADKDGNPYDIKVQELNMRGVKFDVCNNTLMSRKIDPKTVIPEGVIVPSGVAEISKLQSREHYAYIKP